MTKKKKKSQCLDVEKNKLMEEKKVGKGGGKKRVGETSMNEKETSDWRTQDWSANNTAKKNPKKIKKGKKGGYKRQKDI